MRCELEGGQHGRQRFALPNRLVPMGPYDTICTHYASDNNGASSNDREDTVTLTCLPFGSERVPISLQ